MRWPKGPPHLAPNPPYLVLLVCVLSCCFLSFLCFLIQKTVFPLEKGLFCLFLGVSICFSLAFFGLPLFQFLFLCLSLDFVLFSSFLSFSFAFFWFLTFVSLLSKSANQRPHVTQVKSVSDIRALHVFRSQIIIYRHCIISQNCERPSFDLAVSFFHSLSGILGSPLLSLSLSRAILIFDMVAEQSPDSGPDSFATSFFCPVQSSHDDSTTTRPTNQITSSSGRKGRRSVEVQTSRGVGHQNVQQ